MDSWNSLLVASVVGAFASLDVSAVGQFQISRPLCIAPLTGWILGDLPSGIVVGGLVELLWLHSLPVGVAMPLDVCTMSWLATVWTSQSGTAAVTVLSLILAIPAAVLYRKSDIFLRRKFVLINHRLDAEASLGKTVSIHACMSLGLAAFFLRSWLFYGAVALAGSALIRWMSSAIPPSLTQALAGSLPLLVVLGLAVALDTFYEK